MTLNKYRSLIRNYMADYNTLVDPFHSDDVLRDYINDARRQIANEIPSIYPQYTFIFPEAYIDEYDLPSDFITINEVVDIENEANCVPTIQNNAEMLKSNWYYPIYTYNNLFYINEKRKKFVFMQLPEAAEPTFTIKSFDRSTKQVVVNAVSSGSVSDILKWDDIKGYIKLTNSGSDTEYARVSKVTQVNATDYKMYISTFDLLGNNFVNQTLTGSATKTDFTVSGINTLFTEELQSGDTVVINGSTEAVNVISSNTSMTTNTNADVATAVSIVATRQPTFTVGDTVQFATYMLNYYAQPKELVYGTEEDSLPEEMQELVPWKAMVQGYLREFRNDLAAQAEQTYTQELAKRKAKLGKEDAKMRTSGMLVSGMLNKLYKTY